MQLKLAILDLYNGIPNQGMRCIKNIVKGFSDSITFDVFEVRVTGQVPALADYDIFICSGGPGDPLEGDGHWDQAFYGWMDAVWQHNKTEQRKKHIFFICHSFQMAVHHFGLAKVGKRKSISFGTFPVHPNKAGKQDPIFEGLDRPFYVADFRRYQVTEPKPWRLKKIGAQVLALEKIRPHIDLERAVMAVRWSPEIVGTQFHPEADPEGMLSHFSSPEIKAEIINDHGRDKWMTMMEHLSDQEKISATYDQVIPGFLRNAVAKLTLVEEVEMGK
jgi:GMP synthase-like glutamine amidotransferase